jgi:hypothetical protein
VKIIWLAMLGGPTGPDPAFGAPDGEVACRAGRFAVAGVLGDRGISWLLRWCGWRRLGVRRGDASTVTGGKVAEFADEAASARGTGVPASGWDCARSACADASAGINPDISASPRHLFDTPQPPQPSRGEASGLESAMVVVRFTTAV